MRHVLLLLPILSLGFAPLPFPKPGGPGGSDARALEGEWVRTSLSHEGGPYAAEGGEWSVAFDDGKASFRHKGATTAAWEFTLAPSRRPKLIDLKGDGSFLLGVYRLEGDSLVTSFRNLAGAADRPADLEPRPGMLVTVYKRKKP